MPYFDLHCHPFLRPNWITNQPPNEAFSVSIDPGNVEGVRRAILGAFAKPLEAILDSQSCLSHINEADPDGTKIIVATMYAMENSYANLELCGFKQVLQFIHRMKIDQIQEIGGTPAQLQDINANTGKNLQPISYHTLLKRELAIVQNGPKNFGAFRYKIANDFSEIDSDPSVINIILNMEGGHNFYTNSNVLDQEKPENRGKVTENLAVWKKAAFNREVPSLLYITLTHHTTNCLTNHAFGVPTKFAGAGTNRSAGGFNPNGNRISAEGIKFIRTALRQTDDEDRILIDLKHMSLQSRRQWYELRKTLMNEGDFPPIPLIASHMGVNGLSWFVPTVASCHSFPADPNCFEVVHNPGLALLGFRLDDEAPENQRLKFNPWSINLYDEEIQLIVESGGLIGLSFDDRILGHTELTDLFERFSRNEINPNAPDPLDRFPLPSIQAIDFAHPIDGNPAVNRVEFPHTNRPHPQIPRPNYPDSAIMSEQSLDFLEEQIGLLALCQNIIHIIRKGGPEAWNCICIGSDFDGIMDAIDAVPNAGKVSEIRNHFTNFIVIMLLALNRHIEDKELDEPLLDFPPSDFYDRFIFKNAENFLRTHFKRQPESTNLIPDAGGD
jgi:microsomal dipeptidase-like Zn-dependent dipeptidase